MSDNPADRNQTTRHLFDDEESLEADADCLVEGGLVAFPTETVYGLGADATNGEAVARIYAAKGRPQFNPLISHVATLDDAQMEGVFNADALNLAQAFWPGPLTLVVPAQPECSVSDLARAGLPSVALRVPDHVLALSLLAAFGKPIAAPSANTSGRVSPTNAAHVLEDLDGLIDIVLDGGKTQVGVESTIVACLDDKAALLRPGGVARADLERVLGHALSEPTFTKNDAPIAPGLLASHYAPRAKVRLNAQSINEGEAVLDFGRQFPDAKNRMDLSEAKNLVKAAANLFAFLRKLDASGAQTIAVAPIPNEGLGEAIVDRLNRAAAPR